MSEKIFYFLISLILMIGIGVFLVIQGVIFSPKKMQIAPKPFDQSREVDNQVTTQIITDTSAEKTQKNMLNPLDKAVKRISKKPFGIYIDAKSSPVQPERFSGFHTGVDLETNPDEQNVNVPVRALCEGKVLMVKVSSGYGGVLVQSCTLDNQAVTVVYGHLNFDSIKIAQGANVVAGDFLANLGKGFSEETDGERKHLHLAIHKGAGVNILGYVQDKTLLTNWIDPITYLH
jgi:hypothetical protein